MAPPSNQGRSPSAHGRSEVFPAMNRLLTREENVHSDGGQGFPNAIGRVWEPIPGMELGLEFRP